MRIRSTNCVLFTISLVAILNIAYEVAFADPCGCTKTCSLAEGWGFLMPPAPPGAPAWSIACIQCDPSNAQPVEWCNNSSCIGGVPAQDGNNLYTPKFCDDDSCQLYCIACTGSTSSDPQVSDPPGVATGCQPQAKLPRFICNGGDL